MRIKRWFLLLERLWIYHISFVLSRLGACSFPLIAEKGNSNVLSYRCSTFIFHLSSTVPSQELRPKPEWERGNLVRDRLPNRSGDLLFTVPIGFLGPANFQYAWRVDGR
ncbi:hypothetical protein B9Z19DRAFT_1078368 [Tuber borchii]|uniref:Secreted protein n=1 Tax=Tuber borchii TaxID=42251 RepID=A0A2T6ZZH5_TUBBO|nr:hypothetical protein B9Z19DRAFT_1078368 [Tuber borchii]